MTDRSPFTRFSHAVAHGAGRPVTFAVACGGIVLWAVSGPLFGFSETWQLVVNTATTIVTFLMVFVLQNTQNRDGEALQAKLDELIVAGRADNRYVAAERLTEKELRQLRELVSKQANGGVKTAATNADEPAFATRSPRRSGRPPAKPRKTKRTAPRRAESPVER